MKFNVCISREGGCPDTGLCPGCNRQGYHPSVPSNYEWWIRIDAPFTGVQSVTGTVNLLGGVYPGINAGSAGGWTADGGIYIFASGGFTPLLRPTNEDFQSGDTVIGVRAIADIPGILEEGAILGKNPDGVFLAGCTSNELILIS